MTKVIIITRDPEAQQTIRREIDVKVRFVSQSLEGSTGEALIDGEWITVHKDHNEGPYCNWTREIVLD